MDAEECALLEKALVKHKSVLREVNDKIWTHPEVRFTEYYAHDLLTSVLETNGFKVTRNYILTTGFRAEYTSTAASTNDCGKPPANISFICEYDALPEVGHACGHNLIAESGIAMALLTKEVLTELPERYPGKITVIGTPGEEGGGGKIIMIDAFKDVDVAMMIHASNKGILNVESLCSSRIHAKFTTSRLEETNHNVTDHHQFITTGSASDAAIAAYNNIAALRNEMPQDWRVGLIIKSIEDTLGMEITYRTLHGADMELLRSRVAKCLQASADATNCKLEWHFTDPYVELWPNLKMNRIFYGYLKNAESLFQYGIENGYNSSVSTDMGNVSQVVPAIHPLCFINTDISMHHAQFATQARTLEAEGRMLDCAQAMAHTALRLFRCPEDLKIIKDEFATRRCGTQ